MTFSPYFVKLFMINKLVDYFKLSFIELKKVVWPDRKTTIDHTVMVVAISLGVAGLLGGLDFIFTYLFNLLLK